MALDLVLRVRISAHHCGGARLTRERWRRQLYGLGRDCYSLGSRRSAVYFALGSKQARRWAFGPMMIYGSSRGRPYPCCFGFHKMCYPEVNHKNSCSIRMSLSIGGGQAMSPTEFLDFIVSHHESLVPHEVDEHTLPSVSRSSLWTIASISFSPRTFQTSFSAFHGSGNKFSHQRQTH
jgi:hypothetical protein